MICHFRYLRPIGARSQTFFSRSFLQTKSLHQFFRLGSFASSLTRLSAGGRMEDEADSRAASYSPRYIDIGINLSDPIFRGLYHGSRRHPDDLTAVIGRAKEVGCGKLIVTGSDLKSSRDALELTKEYPGVVYSTIGIHPCSSAVFSAHHKEDADGHTMPCDPDPTKPIPEDQEPCPQKTDELISKLASFVETARSLPSSNGAGLVAFGEFGLDYDRLHYCSRLIQLHSFDAQLKLAASLKPQLPLFLHSRAAHSDFVRLLKTHYGEKLERLTTGAVVHSFTGTVEEMRELMHLGLYIGVNGCSFKTAENCAVVKEMDLNYIMIETDGPWCEVRPSHEGWKYLVAAAGAAPSASTDCTSSKERATAGQQSKRGSKKHPVKKDSEIPERYMVFKKEKWTEGAMVKGRNEPCMIERVATIVAGIQGVELQAVCESAWANTVKVFGVGEAT